MTDLALARQVLLRIECARGETFEPPVERDLIQHYIASALIDARIDQLHEDTRSSRRLLQEQRVV